jgi:histidyl-tRNA synthetase
MPDIVPGESDLFHFVEEKARETFRLFEFAEIRTPYLEETEVFTRSIGEATDIVEKEMYSFTDRGGKNVALRPEGTASVIRAYIENGWDKKEDITKLFYAGPMFRGERPQKGRLRQFHQIGAEIIGASGPYIDAELVLNLSAVLKNIGISGFEIAINSLGCADDRKNYKKNLAGYLSTKVDSLCDDCKRRISANVLRVLDCKKEACRNVVSEAPKVTGDLCGVCAGDYAALKNILTGAGVGFKEKPTMVRGLDYYTKTIFEVSHPALGAQDAIGAGGRYDNLVKEMGGKDVGAVGYAIGLERILLAIGRTGAAQTFPGVLVVAMDDASRDYAFGVLKALRENGLAADMDHSGRSIKGGLRKANRENREFVAIVGGNEIKDNKVTLKNMKDSTQESLSVGQIINKLGVGAHRDAPCIKT